MRPWPVEITVNTNLPEGVAVDTERGQERILSVTWEATAWRGVDSAPIIRIRGLGSGTWRVLATFGPDDRPDWAPEPPPLFEEMALALLDQVAPAK